MRQYRRRKPRTAKLDPYLPMIQEITEFDKTVHRNQRHTGPRILQHKTARVTLTHDSAARRIGAGIWLPRNCSGLGDRRALETGDWLLRSASPERVNGFQKRRLSGRQTRW